MGEIKSAAQIAAEKLAALGEPTEQERLKWKYAPVGVKLAASYLKEDINLVNETKQYDDKAKKVVNSAISDILLRNISLPRNDAARKANKKAIDGLKTIKNNKNAVENVYTKIRRVLDHYVQEGARQKKQAYEQLKADFEAKIQELMRQKTGVNARMNIDVEKQPQFQEEWQRVQVQMEGQYTTVLEEYKKELAAID